MHWKSQFISSKHSFFVESFKLKITFSLNSTDHFVPTQAWAEVQKHFYFYSGAKKSLEILSQKLTSNSRDFQGWRMARWKCINTWEKQTKGVICLSAAAQVALRGGGGTDHKQTEAMGGGGEQDECIYFQLSKFVNRL